MNLALRKIATVLLAMAVSIAAGETALRLFTPFPVTHVSNKRADPRLGYVMDSVLKDIDGRGFRNKGVSLEDADLVVIGDSFTYGINVSYEDNLTSFIARKTGRAVYNMGVSGYGIYHHAVLLEDVREYDVKSVIVALYPANDLKDAYCGWTESNYWQARAKREQITIPRCAPTKPRERGLMSRLSASIKNSATGSAIRHLIYGPIRNSYKKWLGQDGENYFRIAGNQVMDRDWLLEAPEDYFINPDHVLNFENSKKFYASASRDFRARGVELRFLFIPSPALIFTAWSRANGKDVDRKVSVRADAEIRIVSEYCAFFESEKISYVDSLPFVLKAFDAEVAAGRSFHPVADVHPYAPGYEAYADAAIEGLRLAEH